jgi:hypothetical protein
MWNQYLWKASNQDHLMLHLSDAEWKVIFTTITPFRDHNGQGGAASPSRQHIRIKQALKQCMADNPSLHEDIAKLSSPEADEAVFMACHVVLKRMADYAIDEDGEKSMDQEDINTKKQ